MAIYKRLHILTSLQRLTLLGQYDIWVRKGAVAVMGAVMHAGSTVHRVHAPSTHSLPVIRACQNPFMPDDQTAEITILSLSNTGIRQLRELSPTFARIWNHRSLPIEPSSPSANFPQRSYTFVSLILGGAQKNYSTAEWLTRYFSLNLPQKIFTVDHSTRLNTPCIGSENLVDLETPLESTRRL